MNTLIITGLQTGRDMIKVLVKVCSGESGAVLFLLCSMPLDTGKKGSVMCRSCADGGRRCPPTPATKTANREAARRYYTRTKARAIVTELQANGVTAGVDLDVPPTWRASEFNNADHITGHTIEDESSPMKPLHALWSAHATHIGDDGSVRTSWDDFNDRNEYTSVPHRYQIIPKPNTVAVFVRNRADMEALARQFPLPQEKYHSYSARRSGYVSFEAMRAAGVTAVVYEAVFSRYSDPVEGGWNSWDVDSVAWLDHDAYTHDTTPAPLAPAPSSTEDEDDPLTNDNRAGTGPLVPAEPAEGMPADTSTTVQGQFLVDDTPIRRVRDRKALRDVLSRAPFTNPDEADRQMNTADHWSGKLYHPRMVIIRDRLGDAVGCAIYEDGVGNNDLHLSNIHVFEQRQKDGAGTAIIQYLAERARTGGKKPRDLRVYNMIQTAKPWYAKVGFDVQDHSATARYIGPSTKETA